MKHFKSVTFVTVFLLVLSMFPTQAFAASADSSSAAGTVPVTNEAELNDAIAAAAGSGSATTIELQNDIEIDQFIRIPTGADITLTGAYQLKMMSNDAALNVDLDANLTIDGITVTHETGTTGVGIVFSGSLYLVSGSVSGNSGGGVRSYSYYNSSDGSYSSATFTMSGGSISNNSAHVGGGVAIARGGTFNMTGGEIFGNTADWTSSNAAAQGMGGGVFTAGTFNLSGGAIHDNSSNKLGGGVYNEIYGTYTGDDPGSYINVFTMTGGEISKNNSNKQGGGVFNGGGFIINGGVISDNKGEELGGGVCNWGAVSFKDGAISGNGADKGGGVWNENRFSMSGGEISGNIAGTSGGGILSYGGFTMTGGKISGNSANDGGGIYIIAGSTPSAISGSTISGNTATSNGGGIWIDQTKLAMLDIASSVKFSSNKANMPYDRKPEDNATYTAHVKAFSWTYPLTQGYNNYDISYAGVDFIRPVIIDRSYSVNSGQGSYRYGATVNIDAGSRPGYNFAGWTIGPAGWGADFDTTILADANSAKTSFAMPNQLIMLIANWTPVTVGNAKTVGFAGQEWWVIGGSDSGVYPKADSVTLMLKSGGDSYGVTAFRTAAFLDNNGKPDQTIDPNWTYWTNGMYSGYFEGSFTDPSDYNDSTLQRKMVSIASSFPVTEQSVINPRTLTAANDRIGGADVPDQLVWPLSDRERSAIQDDTVYQSLNTHWLRTPNSAISACCIDDVLCVYALGVNVPNIPSSPAFSLNLSTVLLTTPAADAGAKSSEKVGSSLASVGPAGDAVKFTFTDASVAAPAVTLTASTNGTNAPGFSYSGAAAGTNRYLSCTLEQDGNAVYYGKLADCAQASSGTFTLPLSGVAAGIYDLNIFCEQANGDNFSDFAGMPASMALVVDNSGNGAISGVNTDNNNDNKGGNGGDGVDTKPPVTEPAPAPARGQFVYSLIPQNYTGEPQGVEVASSIGAGKVTEVFYTGTNGTNYAKSTTAPTNAGSYTVTIDAAAGAQYGAVNGLPLGVFTINPADLSAVNIEIADTAWTGKQIKPAAFVYHDASFPVGANVTVKKYGANKDIGKGTVEIAGKGNFTGTKTVTFSIVPKTNKVIKTTVGAKQMTVAWSKVSAAQKISKYEVRYREKGTETWKTKTCAASASSVAIKSLTKGKQYEIQARSYKTVLGVKYYSAWSAVKISGKIK